MSQKSDTMKRNKITTSILLVYTLLYGAFFSIGAENPKQTAADSAPQAGPYKGCMKIFDGKTFEA